MILQYSQYEILRALPRRGLVFGLFEPRIGTSTMRQNVVVIVMIVVVVVVIVVI
jgi:hypothetical protein